MRKILYTRPDGGVSVVSVPVDTDAAIALAVSKLPATASNPQVVDASVVPTDRTFRNAWAQSGATIAHDMPKARNLHREALRRLREPRLTVLDTEYLRADEAKDDAEKARIAAQKQALRDVTADPAIEAARTPAELKAVLPDALK